MKNISTFILLLSFVTDSPANDSANVLYQKGLEHNRMGLLIDASVHLTDAIAQDDSKAAYFYQRGLSFEGMGQLDRGMKDYKTAVDLKTTELNAYLKLIKYHKERSQYLVILILTDQLIANIPEQAAGAYYDKGKAYEAMNNPASALVAYQMVIDRLEPEMLEFRKLVSDEIKNIKTLLEKKM